MKRVCAWCGIVLESLDGDSDPVTHGICPACFEVLMANEGAASGKRERYGHAVDIQG